MIQSRFNASTDFSKLTTQQLGAVCYFLRYGSEFTCDNIKPLLTYSCLSKLVRLPIRKCHHALNSYENRAKQEVQPNTQSIWTGQDQNASPYGLSQGEINQLVSQNALQQQAQLSIEARAAIFNRQHPGKKLKGYQLRGLYKSFGIKKKTVLRMLVSAKSMEKQMEERDRFFQEYEQAVARQDEIVMIDECVFSSKGYQHSCWSRPGHNVTLSKRFSDTSCVAVVAGISNKRGLIAYSSKRKSIKKEDFIGFLKGLHKMMRTKRYTMLLDQASIHKAYDTKEALSKKNVLYNIPYSPWYNGIELYWAQCKSHYRKALLRRMLDRTTLDMERLVDDALLSVPDEITCKCADNALKKIEADKERLV